MLRQWLLVVVVCCCTVFPAWSQPTKQPFPPSQLGSAETATATALVKFTLLATGHGQGGISPQGAQRVLQHTTRTFTFSPAPGFRVESLLIDYVPVPVAPNQVSYTFKDITRDHAIDVYFGSDSVRAHNFSFKFNTLLPGKLDYLVWTSPSGAHRWVVWDEALRSAGNPIPFYLTLLHSGYYDTAHPNSADGWKYNLSDDPKTETTVSAADISYAPKSEQITTTDPFVQIDATSRGADRITVSNKLYFVGDTFFDVFTITNNSSTDYKTVKVPINVGSLMIGNFNPTTKAIVQSDTRLSRLRPIAGGLVENDYNNRNLAALDEYPLISTFSPVAALWGENRFDAWNDQQQLSGALTVAGQFLTYVDLPTTVGFKEIPFNPSSPYFRAQVTTPLAHGESKTFTVAFTMAEGSEKWREGLGNYKKWFNLTYGNFNVSTAAFESTPQYCPESPFFYFVGSGRSYDTVDVGNGAGRYRPGSTLAKVFDSSPATIDVMSKLNPDSHYGLWKTALTADYLNGVEFNPNPLTIDPRLDAATHPELFTDFINAYRGRGIEPFLYSVPCRYIDGARIDYDYGVPERSLFVPGQMDLMVDLTNPVKRDRYIADLRTFIERGFRGLYFDVHQCPGDYDFLKYVKKSFPTLSFLLTEGSVDRKALLAPSAPLLNTYGSTYNHNNSLLMEWLVPDATYYAGSFNTPFSDDDLDELLQRGYQAIAAQDSPKKLTSWLCKVVSIQSLENQKVRWRKYGKAMGCKPPTEISSACADRVGENEKYIFVTSTVSGGGGGKIEPRESFFYLEGSHPLYTITPDAGYKLVQVEMKNGVYSWTKPCVDKCDKPTSFTLPDVIGVDGVASLTAQFAPK